MVNEPKPSRPSEPRPSLTARSAHDPIVDLDDFVQQSNAKARRRRLLARQMFGGAILTLAVAALLFVAAPNGPSPMPADPEPEARNWRYRDS
jgi:hypothetical protein